MFETHNKRGREIIGHLSYLLLSEDTLAATHRVREAGPAGAPKPRLLDRVREAVRARHYSRRTEKTYVAWVKQATSYIDRSLKGARPGDLPIERPTHFYTVVNLKTARAIGVTVPSSLLVQANQVIE